MWKNVVLYSVFMLYFSCFYAQDVSLEEQLTTQSSTIKEKLIDLKVQSSNMTLLLEQLQKNLEDSKIEVKEWKETSTTLSNSLTTINKELQDSYKTITKLETKLKLYLKILLGMIIALIIMIVCKVIAFILYAKGLPLPRWLDILL